jgi:anaerobic magnesium-protoporphyrin IX monomethyl ester cyclase
MSILLTHAYFLEEDAREQQIMKPYPPLGILSIAAYLEANGVKTDVYDTTFSTKSDFQKYILDSKPPLIGIYVNLMTKINVLELIQFIRDNQLKSKIILGGPEVTHSAEKFLRRGVDYIVIGEGEQTMLALCALSVDPNSTEIDIANISGIAFLKDGKFFQTDEREKLKNLDDLTIPARNKIDLTKYLTAWKERHGKNAISISTMRGCPYTCKWCSRAVYGLSYRRRSPEKVVEEMIAIKTAYHPDTLWFVDDVFTISHKWLSSFRDELKKRNVIIPYECITRADRMNEEVIQLLKDTGCFRVWIGAESGSQKVIDLMDRRVDVNQVRDMIKLTKKHGIEAGTFIMLGYPGETEADIEETIHHLKESNPDHFTITVAYPIRGTELYQEIESTQTTNLEWATSTDRQIDFKRTYSRRYYDFAVKRVINEMKFHKLKIENQPTLISLFKIKSIAAKWMMKWERLH